MDIYDIVGNQIRNARVKKNISAKQLAGVLDCSLASISNYEKAKRWISLVGLEKAAEFLGEPLSYFLEENPSQKGSYVPHPLVEREILKAVKSLQKFTLKELPEKLALLFQKTLAAKYVLLFLMNKDDELKLGNFSGIKKGLLKKLEDLLSLTAENLRLKPGNKLKTIFDLNRPYLITDIASSFSQFGAKRLALLTPSLIDLAKFEAVLLLPLKTNHSGTGLFITCFEKTRDAERWVNSELLVFFCQYAAQVLENARLLEEEKKPLEVLSDHS